MPPKVKKIKLEDDFWHVRFRQPSQFTSIRTPDWAANVARSHSKGAEVRMGRTEAGNWLVQSVLIKRQAGDRSYARSTAKKIVRNIEA